MADVLHRTLPDSELHEPKGVVAAGAGSVYAASGNGSGSWKRVSPDMLNGLAGNGQAGQVLTLDGQGGFTATSGDAYLYGTSITSPSGIPESNLMYVPLRPTNNWTLTLSNNVSVDNHRIVFGVAGLYHATFTLSAYNDGGVTTNAIRSILMNDQSGTVIGAIANDSESSTTLGVIFRMAQGASVGFNKVVNTEIPGVLMQYAIHRIGA